MSYKILDTISHVRGVDHTIFLYGVQYIINTPRPEDDRESL
jgi:hypothetical protein